jgi:hypothetical protein
VPAGGLVGPFPTNPAQPLPKQATISAAQHATAKRFVLREENWKIMAMLSSAKRIWSHGPGGIVRSSGINSERAVVEIETDTEDTVLPVRVTCAGVMLHTESVGAPLQLNETCWLNPPSGLTASVKLADCPAFSVEEPEETETEKSIPVPARLTDCVLGEALSVTDNDPVRLPPADGLNVMLMEQLVPAARLDPQVFVWLKSPLAVILAIVSAALPALVSFTAWAVLEAPTS